MGTERDTAKEAVKKGIVWECPTCNVIVCNDVNYCCECGQRLSWSELYKECEDY